MREDYLEYEVVQISSGSGLPASCRAWARATDVI